MTIRAEIRRVGGALARRGWLGPNTGPLARMARALDRRLAVQGPSSVAEFWDQQGSDDFTRDFERHAWTGLLAIHLNHNYLVTGDRDLYWVDWLRDRYFPEGQAGDVLSLGCGAGHVDRIFGQHGFSMRSFAGLDISPASIALAQSEAEAMSLAPTIKYEAVDLNRFAFPHAAFDFIYFYQSLHHIEALEAVLDGVRKALRPGGLLLVNEFVGPSRFQWTDHQLRLATDALETLPDPLRRDLRTGQTKTTVRRPTIEHMLRIDPSEAVRSAEIERAVKTRFEVIGEWNWGGTINFLTLQDITGNFDQSDASQMAHVERLIESENAAIRDGRIPSDFKMFLAR